MIAGEVRLEIERPRLVAIVRRESADAAAADLRTLVAAGIRALEVSLAGAGALEAISAVAPELPDGLRLGAGTVREVADAEAAVAAGASFLVSPHLAFEVTKWAREHDVLHLPGVFSPSELAAALDAGAELVKLFPAGRSGPGYVRDLLAPFPSARLVPTGGVDEGNAREFLDAGAVAVAVGGALVADGQVSEQRARRFMELTSLST